MDELLQKAAEARGLPASLVERSAKARAEETGQPLEAVLAEWAGEAAPAADDAEDTTETPTEDSTASTEPAEDGVPGEITEDYLVGLASKAKRMPEKLIRTSATARAKHAGLPLEQVLAEWAGVDLDDLKTQAGTATAETSSDGGAAASPAEGEGAGGAASPPAPSATPEAPEAPEPAAPVVDVDELLAKAAAARGVPAALTKRSAQARANEEGTSLEVVLAEWAGVKLPAAPAPAPKPEPEAAETESAAEPEAADDAASEESEEPKEAPKPKGGIEVLEPVGGPIETDVHEVHEPVKLGRYPAWLAAAFLIIPLLAVTYILVSPNGPD
ncbi:MAG: hypothetical protein KDB69_02110, partial [Acidimicrobiia bacterium]|nr:hypothetical protein [Acidimicrobiia bacterium]